MPCDAGANPPRRAPKAIWAFVAAAVWLGWNIIASVSEWSWAEIDDEAAAYSKKRRTQSHFSSDGVDYELVTTHYGWNTPAGRNFPRHIISGELFNATLAHPRHNASAWADLGRNPDPSRRVIAFLDVDTCMESNYPVYGFSTWKTKNMEEGHPATYVRMRRGIELACPYLERAATSPALTSNPDSRLVVIDCSHVGSGLNIRDVCNRSIFETGQVIVGYYSALSNAMMRPRLDVGVPPPAVKPINLTQSERMGLCRKRKYLFSFVGGGKFGREGLRHLQDLADFYVRVWTNNETRGPRGASDNYEDVMVDSHFVGAPRGDCAFSYRFSEALSAGSIPVVYSDNWVLPYNDRVLDWTDCAVFIPESDYSRTAEILYNISDQRRCEMQRCALDMWDRYVATRAGWVKGLVEVAISTWNLTDD